MEKDEEEKEEEERSTVVGALLEIRLQLSCVQF